MTLYRFAWRWRLTVAWAALGSSLVAVLAIVGR